MYGIIGKLLVKPGKRDELSAILLAATREMPGCLSYIVATDQSDEQALWITEVWETREAHTASLSLPLVQQAMIEGKPLIDGFGERFATVPVGGHGID